MKQAKNPIKIDYEAHNIIVNRLFAIRAAMPSSKEYKQLTKIQMVYPNYEIVIRTIKQPQTDRHKGLTYSYMEYYISTHENAETRMAEYQEMRLRAECHSMEYAKIKKWFLAVYPEIDDFTPEDFKKECESEQVKEDNFQCEKLASGF